MRDDNVRFSMASTFSRYSMYSGVVAGVPARLKWFGFRKYGGSR
jgi:hypothetical protein